MEPVTVLISSSPIPSHPDTRIVSETIHSIRWHFKDAPIIVMCDGVRPEQEHRKDDYQKYKENLLTKMLSEKDEKHLRLYCLFQNFSIRRCMTIRTLFLVKTPLVLFVEADSPLVERKVDWDLLSNSLINGATNHIRLHYDEEIHEDHQHMMLPDKILPEPDQDRSVS